MEHGWRSISRLVRGRFAAASRFESMRQCDSGRGSRPSRARGSKHGRPSSAGLGLRVAPFTGAWIETTVERQVVQATRGRALHGRVDRNRVDVDGEAGPASRALHGRVDRNDSAPFEIGFNARRALHGRVDRNPRGARNERQIESRALHGRVDRNEIGGQPLTARRVAPFTGAWIETASRRAATQRNVVAPFTGAWIETGPLRPVGGGRLVAPFTGAWIETTSGGRGSSRR